MRKESIIEMIDKRIIESYVQGIATSSIIEDMNTRIKNMSTVIKMEGLDLSILVQKEFDELDNENIKVRAKYSVFYIKHSTQRIKDLNWLDSKKKTFFSYSNSQIFKLMKLKEKLLVTHSMPF
jgi:hypothetical protein